MNPEQENAQRSADVRAALAAREPSPYDWPELPLLWEGDQA